MVPVDGEPEALARGNEPEILPHLRERGIITLREAALDMLAAGDTSYSEIIPMLGS